MEIKNIVILLLALVVVSNGAVVQWNSTVDCSQSGGCNWITGANWVGGSAPGVNDSAVIDYTNVTTAIQSIFINTTAGFPASGGITVKANIITGKSGIMFILTAPSITVNGDLTLTNTDFIMEDGSITVQNLTFTGDLSNFAVTQGATVDVLSWLYMQSARSTVSFEDTSTLFVYGGAIVAPLMKFYDDQSALFITGPMATFQNGLNSAGITHLANANILGDSSLRTFSATGTISVSNNANVVGYGIFSMGVQAQLLMSNRSSVTIAGGSNVNINSASIDSTSFLEIEGGQTNLASINCQGYLEIKSSSGATISGSSISQLRVKGTSTAVTVQGSQIDQLVGLISMDDDTLATVSFEGDANFVTNITSGVPLNIIVLSGATLTVSQDVNMIMNNNINVYGILNIANAYVNIGSNYIFVIGMGSQLLVEDSNIYGSVRVQGGAFSPTGNTYASSVIIDQGYMSVSFPGGSDGSTPTALSIDNLTINRNGTVYIFDSSNPSVVAPFQVNDAASFNAGTLIVEFMNSVVFDAMYSLMVIPAETTLNFTTTTPIYNSKLYSSQNFQLEFVQDTQSLTMEFFTPSEQPHKLAGWKIFLIILSILIVIGGGCLFFYRYKRNQGYIAIN